MEHWYEACIEPGLPAGDSIVALGVFLSVFFLYFSATKELPRPEATQGIVLGLSKAPQYANLDYMEVYRKKH